MLRQRIKSRLIWLFLVSLVYLKNKNLRRFSLLALQKILGPSQAVALLIVEPGIRPLLREATPFARNTRDLMLRAISLVKGVSDFEARKARYPKLWYIQDEKTLRRLRRRVLTTIEVLEEQRAIQGEDNSLDNMIRHPLQAHYD